MINPVGGSHQSHADQASQVASHQQPRPQLKPPSTEVQDKVTIRRSGDVDHDGDSR